MTHAMEPTIENKSIEICTPTLVPAVHHSPQLLEPHSPSPAPKSTCDFSSTSAPTPNTTPNITTNVPPATTARAGSGNVESSSSPSTSQPPTHEAPSPTSTSPSSTSSSPTSSSSPPIPSPGSHALEKETSSPSKLPEDLVGGTMTMTMARTAARADTGTATVSGTGANVLMKTTEPTDRNHNDKATNETKTALQTTSPQATCAKCSDHISMNTTLRRRIARLNHRLQTASETQRTHGQRILRAFYEQKVSELNEENRRAAANMLNRQKKCFEEELEVMESEARSREASLHAQLDEERTRLATIVSVFERERDALLEKTEETMNAMQRKLGQLHGRSTRLEREKAHLEHAVGEKNLTIETLVSAAAANDAEKRRVDMIAKSSDDERARKDTVIEALQAEVRGLRHRLSAEMEINAQLVQTIETVEVRRGDDRSKHEEELTDCRVESQKEVEKLGRLIATVIQDFANSQSEVSTRSTEECVAGQENAMQSDSTADGDM